MKVSLLGDIAFLEESTLDGSWEKIISNVSPIVKSCDLAIANLETPLTSKTKTSVCKGMHLKSDSRTCNILQALGVEYVSLANNHIFDFGFSSLRDTTDTLSSRGIKYFGLSGSNEIVVDNEISIHGFCCYSTNAAGMSKKEGDGLVVPLTRENVELALEQDARRGLLSILCFHWGDEYSHYPNARQIKFVEEITALYPCIIQGHHAHVVQGIQEVNGSAVFYNQGNFYFDKCISPVNEKLVIEQSEETRRSYLAILDIQNGRLVSQSIVGVENAGSALEVCDIDAELSHYSDHVRDMLLPEVAQVLNEKRYALRSENHPSHDIKWLASKLNYYSIGAKLKSYINDSLYKKAF